jgi:hypothetical protein
MAPHGDHRETFEEWTRTRSTQQERSFDELTKGLASGSMSRGKALRLMAGAFLGGAIVSIPGFALAQQAPTRPPGGGRPGGGGQGCTHPGEVRVNGQCVCPSGTTLCGGSCVSNQCGTNQQFNTTTCQCQTQAASACNVCNPNLDQATACPYCNPVGTACLPSAEGASCCVVLRDCTLAYQCTTTADCAAQGFGQDVCVNTACDGRCYNTCGA